MGSKENPARLLDELFKTTDVIGTEMTIKILRSVRDQNRFTDANIGFVVKLVADTFGVDINEILFGIGRKNERIYAIGFCTYYLKDHFQIPIEIIKDQLNKNSIQVCYYYYRMIVGLDSKIHSHRKYIDMKSDFDKQILIRKNSLTSTNKDGNK